MGTIAHDRRVGGWPQKAAEVCLRLTGNDDETQELTILLLRDIGDAFTVEGGDRIPSSVLLHTLRNLDERPWRSMLTSFKLAQLLRPFRIHSRALWASIDGGTKRMYRGYFFEDFKEAFERYT